MPYMNNFFVGKARRGALVALVGAALSAFSLNASAQTKDAVVDPKARELLLSMSSFIGSARSLSFTSKTLFETVTKSGIKLLNVIDQRFLLQRPDKIHVRSVREDGVQREIWFDGRQVTALDLVKNGYQAVTLEKAAGLDDLFDALGERYNVSFPVIDLLYSKPFARISGDIVSAVYVGKRNIGGVPTHLVSLESNASDWQIWIKDGKEPFPMRIAVTYVTHAERPGFISILSDWRRNDDAPASKFAFKPPPGARAMQLFQSVKK